MRASEVRFLRGRVTVGGSENPAPFPTAIAVFRPGDETGRCVTWNWGLTIIGTKTYAKASTHRLAELKGQSGFERSKEANSPKFHATNRPIRNEPILLANPPRAKHSRKAFANYPQNSVEKRPDARSYQGDSDFVNSIRAFVKQTKRTLSDARIRDKISHVTFTQFQFYY